MIIIKKNKNNENKVYYTIVRKYIDYLKLDGVPHLPMPELSEILRLSLCYAFDLETEEKIVGLKCYAKEFAKFINNMDISCDSYEYKQGLTEACIHCFEISRKKAGV